MMTKEKHLFLMKLKIVSIHGPIDGELAEGIINLVRSQNFPFTKFSEKLTFLAPDTHTYVCV